MAGQPVMSVSMSSTASIPKATNIDASIAILNNRFFQARLFLCDASSGAGS